MSQAPNYPNEDWRGVPTQCQNIHLLRRGDVSSKIRTCQRGSLWRTLELETQFKPSELTFCMPSTRISSVTFLLFDQRKVYWFSRILKFRSKFGLGLATTE